MDLFKQIDKVIKEKTEELRILDATPPPLWAHQRKAIEEASKQDYYAFFFEVGCGKTRALIETLLNKYKFHEKTLKTLILCPLIVVENFKREFQKFGPKELKVVTLTGPNAVRLKEFEKVMHENCIVITNYEAILNPPMLRAFFAWRAEIFVADELHKLKDVRAKRTKFCTALADLSQYRYGLSGTPVLNTQLDLFSQIRLLDKGRTFGSNFFIFRNQYFFDANINRKSTTGYFPQFVPRAGINEALKEKIKPFSMSVKKKDCLDLPPLLTKTVETKMSEEQKRMYIEMKRDFVTYLHDKACVASLAITKALRLQQIVSGFVKLQDAEGKETEMAFKDVPRLDILKELLENITPTAKVIVWAVFKKNYEQIQNVCASLHLGTAMLHGGVLFKQEEVDKFQNNPHYRVMIAHPGSGGIGINLTAASYMIYYSKNFSLEQEIQSEGRNYRGGSEIHESITRIDLVCPKTIDETILKILANKKKIGENILSNEEVFRQLKDAFR